MSRVISKYLSPVDIKPHNNAESPFLRLPLELKTRIYEYVCGGKTIHIEWHDRRLSHYLCDIEFSEEEAQKKFDASEEVWYAVETVDRHLCCCTDTIFNFECRPCRDLRDHFNSHTKLDISLLFCCRQMYLESNLVPYYANTFSFGSPFSLTSFCHLMPMRFKRVIRGLHVRPIVINTELYTQVWHTAFGSVTASLTGLQRLHITMELFPYGQYLSASPQGPDEKSMLSTILQVGKLNLKAATVVLSDSHFTHDLSVFRIREREKDERWTLAQKQEWSRYLRKALLHYEDRDAELAKVKQEALEQGRICRL